MGAILALIPSLLPIFQKIIASIFPDKEKQDQAMIQIQQALNEAQAKLVEASKDVVITEMNQGGILSKWRAILMTACTALLIFDWMLVPVLNCLLKLLGTGIDAVPVPSEVWYVLQIGLGGYVGERMIEKHSNAKYGNDAKFFQILRSKMFKNGLTEDQVNVINEALKARDEN